MSDSFVLGVVSDSHMNRSAVERAAVLLAHVDAIAHLGDGVSDVRMLSIKAGKPVFSVCGNCDPMSSAPEEIVEVLRGHPILMCHGHRYRVKHTLLMLALRAQEVDAQVALFGHTHAPYIGYDGGVLLFNPGSLSGGSYGQLEIGPHGLKPTLHDFY